MADLPLAALAVLDGDHRAHLLLDQAFAMLWANAGALTLLAGSHGIEIRDGEFAANGKGVHEALRASIANSQGQTTTFIISGDQAGEHLIVRSRRIDLDSGAVFAVQLNSSGNDFAVSCSGVESAYRLTPSEYQVLCELMAGHDADAIAATRSVSVQTTRSHIKSLYAKMAVRSREAMFRRVAPFLL